MRHCPRDPLTGERTRWLLAATLLAFGLGWGGKEATASSLKATERVAAEADAHSCKCGDRCRGHSCCCKPRKPQATLPTTPVAEPTVAGPLANASPCLNAAPCGDSGLPNVPSGVSTRFCKSATLTEFGQPLPAAINSLTAPSSRCLLPARRASRLDKPPRPLAIA
ncbi:hypothetical protein SAMN05444166_5523 [Singulisphaera sp. GP187]|nr:hypothetical protein SAMN05444166_5523 [Singulisphaera sp. GP187]